jgi:hypothetical protein
MRKRDGGTGSRDIKQTTRAWYERDVGRRDGGGHPSSPVVTVFWEGGGCLAEAMKP